MKSFNTLSAILVTTSLSLGHIDAASAVEQHQHTNKQHTSFTMQLNQGQKWKTDSTLRQGMKRINNNVIKAKPAFNAETLTAPDAKILAKYINQEIEYIITNCKLEPMADSTLHVLIGELLHGTKILGKEPLSAEGLPRIINALNTYPEYFNHPGWTLKH